MNKAKLRNELSKLLKKQGLRIAKIWVAQIFKTAGGRHIKEVIPYKVYLAGMNKFLKVFISDIEHTKKGVSSSELILKKLILEDFLSDNTAVDVTQWLMMLRAILAGLLVRQYKRDFEKLKYIITIIIAEIDKSLLCCSKIYKKRKFTRIKTIMKYGKKLIKVHDLNKVYHLILEAAVKESGSDRGLLMVLEKDGYLYVKSSIGIPKKAILPIRQKLGIGVTGRVINTGEPVIINKGYKTRLYRDNILRRLQLKTAVSIPIFADSTIAGVISVGKHGKKPLFDEEDVELLLILAQEAGAAITNCHLINDMHELYLGSIISLAAAIDARDHYTHGHSNKVAKLATATARALGLPRETIKNIQFASLLHDIGKIGIPDKILLKPGKLTYREFEVIKRHPAYGVKILKHIPRLELITPIIYHEHEHYDGTGYLKGLKGLEIPIESRIISVADAYEAMTSNRPYRKILSKKEAVKELKRCAGIQFDPEIVRAFLRVIKK